MVTKLDRLGRNAMDVRATVEELAASGVRVHCLALGGVDLTSAAGKMTMQVLNAVAEFERDLLIATLPDTLSATKRQGMLALVLSLAGGLCGIFMEKRTDHRCSCKFGVSRWSAFRAQTEGRAIERLRPRHRHLC